MKIVISPAKSLNFERKVPVNDFTKPIFVEEIQQINEVLKGLTPNQLSKLMNISEKLADLNWQRNQEFQLPFTLDNSKQAIYVFDGDVYDGLDILSFNNQEVLKLQDKLRIISGQYGLLKPLDIIQAYRLEMGTKIQIKNAMNLYEFWEDKITNAINSELNDTKILINLASNEYFKVINTKKIKATIITPVFKDYKGEELKVISFYAKKARGLMVKYIIKNNIQSVDDLKGFNYEGYTYSENHSKNKNELLFIR